MVLVNETREEAKKELKRRREELERRRLKVSRIKTEYMCLNKGGNGAREASNDSRTGSYRREFKHLGSTIGSDGKRGKEVKKRV